LCEWRVVPPLPGLEDEGVDLNSPVGQFVLIVGIFIFLLKIKKRNA